MTLVAPRILNSVSGSSSSSSSSSSSRHFLW